MNIVAARTDDGKTIFRRERDIFVELPAESNDAKAFLDMAGAKLVTSGNKNYVVGEEAMNFASFLDVEFKRPLKSGLINPHEEDTAIQMLDIIIKSVLDKPRYENETCVFCIPAEPIDDTRNVSYHQKTLEYLVKRAGFTPKAINEATAIIYSELQNNSLSGIGISFGAGMINLACLRGDTKIPLLSGETKTIKELSDLGPDNEFWVYSCREDGQIVPGKAWNAHKKQEKKEIIRLWFDNDEYLDCTRDHKIMMRDGTYREAQDLKEKDSLMPLYTEIASKENKYTKNYARVKNNKTNRWNFIHRLVSSYFGEIKKGEVIHHKNFNKLDNSPDNLLVCTTEEHGKIHKRKISKTLKSKYESGELISSNQYTKNELELVLHNHKVKRIEKLNIVEDVYDITVEKYHNFAIDSGIFVHNCTWKGFPVFSFSIGRSGDWIDEQVKQASGKTAAEITGIKETELDLTVEGETRIHRYLKGYYEELMDYLIRNIIKKFEVSKINSKLSKKSSQAEALPIVVAGGTSIPKGFAEMLRDRVEKSDFPFKISKIIVAADPLYTVAKGLAKYGEVQVKSQIN